MFPDVFRIYGLNLQMNNNAHWQSGPKDLHQMKNGIEYSNAKVSLTGQTGENHE